MEAVFVKSSSFLLVILLGVIFRSAGIFGEKDHRVLSNIVLKITLPAAVITSTANMAWQPTLLLIPVLSLMANWVMIGVGAAMARGKTNRERVLYMVNCPSWNIGAFALPFLQSFLGAGAVMAGCLFDVGNSLMCTGGTYALVSVVCGGEKPDLKSAGKKLLSSVPFVTYVTMLLLVIFGVTVPQTLLDLISPIAVANPFVAMLMVGAMFRVQAKPAYLWTAARILGVRLVLALVLSVGCYYLAPFSLEVRQGLAVMVFAPISVIAPAFTERCGGDEGLASFINSLSILLGVVGMLAAILVLGVL